MTTNFVRSLILSAAVLTLGAAANAQSNMTATIPFSFKIHGKVLPSGSYRLEALPGSRNAIQIVDVQSGKSALTLGTPDASTQRNARLVFRCGETTGCSLAEAWSGDGSGWKIPQPSLKPAEKERVAVIPLRRSDAE